MAVTPKDGIFNNNKELVTNRKYFRTVNRLTIAKWLKEHTGVEIISRDRGTEYISGANEGAPGAIQAADLRVHF
jgi:hypothetical protein